MSSNDLSAGLLMFRLNPELEVYLVHPGGPFFKNKDEGFWTIPKGLIEEDEDPFQAAIREFIEETGIEPEVKKMDYLTLGKIEQKAGKVVHAWAFETERSNTPEPASNYFEMEWPPNSGNFQKFQEIDDAAFFKLEQASAKINEAQQTFLNRLENQVT